MYAYLKLIRWPNLLIIGLAMYLLRFCVLRSVFMLENTALQMSEPVFFLLVLSSIFIAAGGYIINDYFDVKIDRINKPDKVIVGVKIPFRRAMMLHIVLNVIGVLLGFYTAYKVGLLRLGLIHLVVAFLLWLYSVRYKRFFLLGNLMVAFLSALIILIVWLYEFFAIGYSGLPLVKIVPVVNLFVFSYAGFAFFTTLIREILKDIEDMEGDKKYNCRTIPILLGLKTAKITVASITVFCFLMIALAEYNLFIREMYYAFAIFLFAVELPFIYLFVQIIKAREKRDFGLTGDIAKLLMIFGILTMQVFYSGF